MHWSSVCFAGTSYIYYPNQTVRTRKSFLHPSEAGVRATKGLLVGTHSLSFKELTTILAEVESILNSRPQMFSEPG